MTSRYFEDFTVGERFESGTRVVTDTDLKAFTEISGDRHRLHTDPEYAATTRFGSPIVHGPFGVAVFFGLFHDLHLVDDTVVALLDTDWRYLAPVTVGDTLRFRMTITRCRRTSSGSEGVVNRHVVLLNQRDEPVQEGSTAMLVRARDTGPDPVWSAFGTAPWADALVERLAADVRFTSATSSWDGTVGLRCGDAEIHLRVYRGAVIEVTRRAPHGATFTLAASELTWTELVTGPVNDFMRRAMRGQFQVTGSGYEYLRLTKVLHVIVDNARALAAEGAAR
ncbi:MaoC/PaaZ C-terminal domain-containing protein [Planosporangium sp. 12N6]|uniref:MaoC/PaaZ C-terminal domain-containing protein n=1 Tax=Planosporangium spinosum TaxID=3402278 RepID=UPI003CF85592